MTTAQSSRLLTLREIAAWQIPALLSRGAEIHAELPALQLPTYDPTSVDQLDDADRPWDFDHIHPRAHIEHKKGVPQ
jgi:hypothetical protein